MENEEITKSYEKQVIFIRKMFSVIETESSQMMDSLRSLCNISSGLVQYEYPHPEGDSIKLKCCMEENRVSNLKKAKECHDRINQNLKKLTELINVNGHVTEDILPIRRYSDEGHCGRIG